MTLSPSILVLAISALNFDSSFDGYKFITKDETDYSFSKLNEYILNYSNTVEIESESDENTEKQEENIDKAPENIIGIFNYNGLMIKAVDLCPFLGFEPSNFSINNQLIIANVDGKERGRVRIVIGKANPNMALNEEFATYLMAVGNELYP